MAGRRILRDSELQAGDVSVRLSSPSPSRVGPGLGVRLGVQQLRLSVTGTVTAQAHSGWQLTESSPAAQAREGRLRQAPQRKCAKRRSPCTGTELCLSSPELALGRFGSLPCQPLLRLGGCEVHVPQAAAGAGRQY